MFMTTTIERNRFITYFTFALDEFVAGYWPFIINYHQQNDGANWESNLHFTFGINKLAFSSPAEIIKHIDRSKIIQWLTSPNDKPNVIEKLKLPEKSRQLIHAIRIFRNEITHPTQPILLHQIITLYHNVKEILQFINYDTDKLLSQLNYIEVYEKNKDAIKSIDHIQTKNFLFRDKPYEYTGQSNRSGRKSDILQLKSYDTEGLYALKVFKPEFARYYSYAQERMIQDKLATSHGFNWVHQRIMLHSRHDGSILNQYPIFQNAILMPWIESPPWGTIKMAYINDIKHIDTSMFNDKTAANLALLLSQALAELEINGMAHGDICDSNVLIDLAKNQITIVDVEDMYMSHLAYPDVTLQGTPSYQFNADFSAWTPYADRFAGALLICELLCLPQLSQDNRLAISEGYFLQEDINNRNTRCVEYIALCEKLQAISPELNKLFVATWTATTLEQCPSLTKWRDAITQLAPAKLPPKANSNQPALVIFALDHSDSMSEVTPDREYRHDKMYEIVNSLLEHLVEISQKGNLTYPRYHIALFCYGKTHINWLAQKNSTVTCAKVRDYQHIKQRVEPDYEFGIWQLGQLEQYFDTSTAMNYKNAQKKIDSSDTYMTSMFTEIYDILSHVIEEYADCPPPTVIHITDGNNYDNGNLAELTSRIRDLKTNHGNVTISNTYIGSDIVKLPDEIEAWPGITDNTKFLPASNNRGELLRSMSSKIPSMFLDTINKGQYNLSPDSYMLFPSNHEDMIKLSIVAATATVSQAIDTQTRVIGQQRPLD
jgi:RIO-like serine/threonine protein kinase